MLRTSRWAVVVLVVGLGISACGGKPALREETASSLEAVEGSEVWRVKLSARAAERLDLRTALVREEPVERTRLVGAEVVAAPTGKLADAGVVWVRVALSEGEASAVDNSGPAWVWPLTGDDGAAGISAEPVASEANTELAYAVNGSDYGLVEGQKVRVELPLLGSGQMRLVVPYASVIYDQNGETWAYTNPEPLVFVRQPISVDYIEGDLAVLSGGPAAGTEVVSLGAAELFGVETGIGA